ncbi:MAG: VOC family protein [Planctomycetota bacterium]
MAQKKGGKVARRRTKAKVAPRGKAANNAGGDALALSFNHAMIYVTDVASSLAFYRDALGFRAVDEYPGAYARLVAPQGDATIALHTLEPGQTFAPATEGMRLYFEVKALDKLCARMVGRGVQFTQLPKDMPWGWRHAYLKDPDGHELSLYWAGAARLRATRMSGGDDH